MTKKILMIVGDFVENMEAFAPFNTLKVLGFQVDTVCPKRKKGEYVLTAIHEREPTTKTEKFHLQTYTEKRGHCIPLTTTFDEIDPKNYEALVIPGGRSPEYLRMIPKVVEIVKYFIEANKPVTSLGHGSQLLVATNSMQGRKLTCYPTCAVEVKLAGAHYQRVEPMESIVDGKLVTGEGWESIPSVLIRFTELLGVKVQAP